MPTYRINGKTYQTQEPLNQEQLKRLARQATGQAIETNKGVDSDEVSYFDQVKASALDVMPELGGLSGAAAGAALGAPLGPAGALVGGAIGAFTGAGAGKAGQNIIEDFDNIGSTIYSEDKGFGFNPDVAKSSVNQALETVGKASQEGILDITGAKAIDIFMGVAKPLVSQVGKLLPKSKQAKDFDEVVELQQELRRQGLEGSTLRGTQARPESAVIEGVESASEGGIGIGRRFDEIAEAQQAYMDTQIDALIKSQSRLSTEQTGDLMHNLIKNTRVASSEAYGKVFEALDEAGKGVKINIQGIRNNAMTGKYQAMEGLTKVAEDIAKRGGKIPLFNATIKGVYDDILKLSPNMSFATAYNKLKYLKGTLSDLAGDPATANSKAVQELTMIVKNFEDQMLGQATKLGDTKLVTLYRKTMNDYSKSQKTLFSDTMTEALKKDPELVARTLLSEGRTTPIKDIKRLVAEAKKLKRSGELTGTVSDPLKGLRRSFMEKALSGQGGKGIEQVRGLESKLAEPDFRRTFEALYDEATVAKVDKLIKQAQILSRGPGGELALSIRSQQVSGATAVINPQRGLTDKAVGAFIALLPSKMAQYITKADEIDKLLNLNKTIIRAYEQNKPIPAAALRAITVMVGEDVVDIESDRRQRNAEEARQRYGVK